MITAKAQFNGFPMKPIMYFKYARNAVTLLNDQPEFKHKHNKRPSSVLSRAVTNITRTVTHISTRIF